MTSMFSGATAFNQALCWNLTSVSDQTDMFDSGSNASFLPYPACSIRTLHPTAQPTSRPTTYPTMRPTSSPTTHPSAGPTFGPTIQPTGPTTNPTAHPSAKPSTNPTAHPSANPSANPTARPTTQLSENPTARPTAYPTAKPSLHPTMNPTYFPTVSPSFIPSQKPSTHPTTRPTARPSELPTMSLWPYPWKCHLSHLYGNGSSIFIEGHASCPTGSKVISIKAVAANWINQLTATCDDKNKTILGPWGNPQGNVDVLPSCSNGFKGWNITHGAYISQIDFECSTSLEKDTIGLGLPIGTSFTNDTILLRNQSIVGLQVYYDSTGIHAMSLVYADFPPTSECYDSMGEPTGKCSTTSDRLGILWGFLAVFGVVTIVGAIAGYIWRKRHKREFQEHDNILPLR